MSENARVFLPVALAEVGFDANLQLQDAFELEGTADVGRVFGGVWHDRSLAEPVLIVLFTLFRHMARLDLR